jgi:hypothetical protein
MEKIIITGIYKITNPKGKVYIGQSTNIFNRWEDYKKNKCKGQVKLYNSFKKYGFDNHIFEILEECSLEQLDKLEYEHKSKFIKNEKWENTLFLMLLDGKGGNKNISTKNKMSISSTKINKPVNVYDLKGNLINTFQSPSEAKQILFPNSKESTGGILLSCRRGKQKTHRNYIFQFQDDDKINEILKEINNNIKIKQKTVLQYDLKGNFIKEYKNSYQVEKEFKKNNIRINSTDIRACCDGKQKTAKGYKWEYGELLVDTISTIKPEIINERKNKFNELKEEFKVENLLKQNYKNIIYSFIEENYKGKIQLNYNKEIDIFLPEYNIGFNIFDLKKISHENSKILKKLYTKYLKNNIKLIQIYSDEIINKIDIVKSRIKNSLNVTPNKIYARNCIIKEVNNFDKKLFLNENHIQGEDKSKIKLGLYHNNELVSLMTFRLPRHGIGKTKNSQYGTYELIRFCNKKYTNVIGAASKLLKYFIKIYNPTNIFSFADNRWSSPIYNVYLTCGFNKTNSSNHGYFYTKDFVKRLHRSNFTKTKLKQLGFTEDKTEYEIMKLRGYYKIYDCGTTRYEYNLI